MVVGRPIAMRYGKFSFMPPEKVERAGRFMHRYEGGGIFFARLLPVIRQLIHAVKHESIRIVVAILVVCVLYWVGMRLTVHETA